MAGYGDAYSDKEQFDSPAELDPKITSLVDLIHKSGHFVVFTGAGISTWAAFPTSPDPKEHGRVERMAGNLLQG